MGQRVVVCVQIPTWRPKKSANRQAKELRPPVQCGGPFLWLWPFDEGIEASFQVEAFPALLFELAS
jgi:hypothetical protein